MRDNSDNSCNTQLIENWTKSVPRKFRQPHINSPSFSLSLFIYTYTSLQW